MLLDLGIEPVLSFMNFTPTTTLRHLRENLRFFPRFGTNILHSLLNRYQVFAGTPLADELRSCGRLRGSFPTLGYTGVDKGAELAYGISQESLGAFLQAGDELKRLRRKSVQVRDPG